MFSPWYSWKIAELTLSNNHCLTHSIKVTIISLITSQKRPRHMTSQKRPRHMTLEINMFSEIQENIANTKMYTVQPPHQTSLIPPYFCVCSKHRFKIYMASVVISVIRILRLNLIKIKCLLHFFTFFFSDSLLSNGIHLGVIK